MPVKKKKKRKSTKIKPNRRALWLKYFLDKHNPSTFFNQTESAARANYKSTSRQYLSVVGSQNLSFYKVKIAEWLDEEGLSETALKAKLMSLIEAKETKFFQKDGRVVETRNVEALETQRRSLDMAFKVTGLYAPEKREHTGKGGGPIETKITDFPAEPKTIKEWEEQRKEAEAKRKEEE